MSSEIFTSGPTGLNLYAVVYSPAALVWNTTTLAFETPLGANFAHYAITLTEDDSSGTYVASFPMGINTPGDYPVQIKKKAGGSPAVSDVNYASGVVSWNGSSVNTSGTYLISLSEYKAFYGITTTDNDAQYTALIAGIAAQIDSYLQWHVIATDYNEVLNGTGNNFIRLINKPINSISSITLGLDQPIQVSVDLSNILIWSAQGMIEYKPSPLAIGPGEIAETGNFQKGFQNIGITYNAGFLQSNVPADLKLAASRLTFKMFNLTNPAFLTSGQKWGGFNISFGGQIKDIFTIMDDMDLQTLNRWRKIRYIF